MKAGWYNGHLVYQDHSINKSTGLRKLGACEAPCKKYFPFQEKYRNRNSWLGIKKNNVGIVTTLNRN